MPLSPPVERELQHRRNYEFTGYHRADGLFDIEGRITDVKTYAFDNEHRGRIEPGEPLHDMWIRLTIDDEFRVHDIEAVTDASPFAICPAITPNFKKIVGDRITGGWRLRIRDKLGGTEGCTHLVEMLGAMGTAAYQTLYPFLARKHANTPVRRRPPMIDTCHAYASDGELVKRAWPDFYTGE